MPSVPDSTSGNHTNTRASSERTPIRKGVKKKKKRKPISEQSPNRKTEELTSFKPPETIKELHSPVPPPVPPPAAEDILKELKAKYAPSRPESQANSSAPSRPESRSASKHPTPSQSQPPNPSQSYGGWFFSPRTSPKKEEPEEESDENPRRTLKSSKRIQSSSGWTRFNEDSVKEKDNKKLFDFINWKKKEASVQDCVIAYKRSGLSGSEYQAIVFLPEPPPWESEKTRTRSSHKRTSSGHPGHPSDHASHTHAARAWSPIDSFDKNYIAQEFGATKEDAVFNCIEDVRDYAKGQMTLFERLTRRPSR